MRMLPWYNLKTHFQDLKTKILVYFKKMIRKNMTAY